MATFPSITPTYGQQKRSAPNTRTVRFADGYEHRILFGLAAHQNPKIYTPIYSFIYYIVYINIKLFGDRWI